MAYAHGKCKPKHHILLVKNKNYKNAPVSILYGHGTYFVELSDIMKTTNHTRERESFLIRLLILVSILTATLFIL